MRCPSPPYSDPYAPREKSADPALAGFTPGTVPAHRKDDLAGCTAGLFLKVAPVAVRFGEIIVRTLPVIRSIPRSPLLELVNARGADGIEAGLALLPQWFAAPVKVRHDGIPALVLCR